MSRRLLAVWMLMTVVARAEDHTHHHDLPPPGDAQIVVTINPEARVSAIIGAPLPPPVSCGSTTALKLKVFNQGFVTAPLRAALVEDSGRHVQLHLDGARLSGEPEDSRTLHLTPLKAGPVDVTIAFSIDHNIGDLGGRDRVHILLLCVEGR